MAEKWAKRDGKNFDEEYPGKRVDEHSGTVKLLQMQALDGDRNWCHSRAGTCRRCNHCCFTRTTFTGG